MSNLRTLAYHHAEVARSTAEHVVVPAFDYNAVPLVEPRKTWKWLIPVAAILVIGLIVVLQNSPATNGVVPGPPDEVAFHTTGLMSDPCWSCETLVLKDGRVLVFSPNLSGRSSTIEVFDPETWSFSQLSRLDTVCGCHPTELPDGRVLMFLPDTEPLVTFDDKGQVQHGVSLSGIQPYLLDADTGSLTPLGEKRDNWWEVVSSVVLDDGRVLVSGRVAGFRGLAIVDVDAATFNHVASITSVRWMPELGESTEPKTLPLVPLPDGRVLALHTTWGGAIFDPTDDSVTNTPLAAPANTIFAGVGNGRYLMMIQDTSRAALFDPAPVTATDIDDAPGPVAELIALDGGDVLAMPADDGPWMVFDSASGQFATIETGPWPGFATGPLSWTRTANGRILFATTGSTTIFDPNAREFVAGPPLTAGRNPASLATLADGRVVAFGMRPTTPLSAFTAPELASLRSRLDQMGRSGEMMAAGGSSRPEGCCAAVPSVTTLRIDQMLSVEQVVAWTTGDLDLVITTTDGSLLGLVGVGYVAGLLPLDPTDRLSMERRYVSGMVDTAFTDCQQGCTIPIAAHSEYDSSGPGAKWDAEQVDDRGWEEFDTNMTLEVHLLYDGPIPASAKDITLTVSD